MYLNESLTCDITELMSYFIHTIISQCNDLIFLVSTLTKYHQFLIMNNFTC